MILQVLFYAEFETFVLICFKMQIQLEKLGPPFENFWLRHGGVVYHSNLSTFDFSRIKLNRLFSDVTMTLLQNANTVQTLGTLFRN